MTTMYDEAGVLSRAVRCIDQLDTEEVLPGDTSAAVAVLLVGSRARGWANPTSDHDFCVVTNDPFEPPQARAVAVALSPPQVMTREVVLPDGRCEFAYWTEDQLRQMLEKVSWARFDSGEASLNTLGEVEETVLERLATAIPLVGEHWLGEFRGLVHDSAFRTFMTTRSISAADGKIEDIQGMLAIGDTYSAVLAARLALDHLIDALLDSRGNYGSRIPKWRMRRLGELAEPAITVEEYWAYVTMADFSDDNRVQWVNDVVRRCQTLSLAIEI